MTSTINIAALALLASASVALADAHAMAPSITASDQSVANGVVSAESITASENGWLVVHSTDADMKPGLVVGYAPIRAGKTTDVAAILQEDVASGQMLMLMVHGETGGTQTGVFEYTLGATEDGPVKPEGALVMAVVTAE
jgi:hypothetical protein|tara:strand:- start:1687 stop:2106 length:420 start_codon:yes stop_codon:yes gene_type:complete